jgi:hypothetical protein
MISVFKKIDAKAKNIAEMYCEGKKITLEIAGVIIDLYKSEEELKEEFKEDASFLMSYHEPISSKLEFFLARLFYHVSKEKKLDWKVYLRKQEKRCAPDIRVEKGKETIFILEVKANAGWMQCFISSEMYKKDEAKGNHPERLIESHKKQLTKYRDTFGKCDVYMFLPTLKSVHREKYETKYEGYKNNFEKNTGLSKDKFVILSNYLQLNLAEKKITKDDIKIEQLTDDFEKMLDRFTK